MVLERFDEHLTFFKFKFDFNAFCYSKFPDFENLYILLTINKVRSAFRTCNSSQASQDGFTVRDFVKPDRGQNEIISRAEKTPDVEEKHENGNNNNIETFKRERLDVNSSVAMLLIFQEEISLKLKSPSCLRV